MDLNILRDLRFIILYATVDLSIRQIMENVTWWVPLAYGLAAVLVLYVIEHLLFGKKILLQSENHGIASVHQENETTKKRREEWEKFKRRIRNDIWDFASVSLSILAVPIVIIVFLILLANKIFGIN